MTRRMSAPRVPAIVEGSVIRLVEPYRSRGRLIVAHVELYTSSPEGHGIEPLLGKIPIDEISPYADFDPAALSRSWRVKAQICDALLRNCDRRFAVIEQERNAVVLSLKRVALVELATTRTDHTPVYTATSFRRLHTLHHHVLKHALGLDGGDPSHWLDVPWAQQKMILDALKHFGCPETLRFTGNTLAASSPCRSCEIGHKISCFEILAPVRRIYEHAAAACTRVASDRREPRHYHYVPAATEATKGRPVMVFMDAQGRKAVARATQPSVFATVTLFHREGFKERADDRAKFAAERRRLRRVARESTQLKICTPPAFGFR